MQSSYTTNEAATLLGMKPRSVTRHIERGNIAAQRRGRDYLISRDEIERFLRERRKAGRPKEAQQHERG